MDLVQNQRIIMMTHLKALYQADNCMSVTHRRKQLDQINFQLNSIEKQQIKKAQSIIRGTSVQKRRSKSIQDNYKKQANILCSHLDISNLCILCQQYIFDQPLTLECQHKYHEACLSKFIRQQVSENIKFQCQCKMLITTYDICQLLPSFKLVIQAQYEFQVEQFRKMEGIQRCANKYCSFFWMKSQNIRGNQLRKASNKYCPYCLLK